MSDINCVNLYNRTGTLRWMLTPISCEVSETINGEDRLTMSCVYDENGMWKQLLPGNKIGVNVTRCETIYEDDIGIVRNDIIKEYYRIASDTAQSVRKIYENIETIGGEGYSDTGKFAATGQIVTIDGHESNQNMYYVDSVRATTGTTYSQCLIADSAIEIVRETKEKSFENMTVSTDEETYVITNVTFTEQYLSVEAVHKTIDMCSNLIYIDRTSYTWGGFDKVPVEHALYSIVDSISTNATETGQKKGNMYFNCCVNETCVIDTSEWCMSVNELMNSKLPETYDYEILRKRNIVSLYEYIGSDRGVVLEVGRNLTALQIDMSRDGSDMNGVLAYCLSYDKKKIYTGWNINTVTVGNNATRTVAIEDTNAAAIAWDSNEKVVKSRLKITAQAYRNSREFKDIGAYTISVRPQLAQIPELWTNTPIALGDIVTIRDPRLPEGELKQRVVQRTQDCLTGLVKTITVCDVPKSMYDVIKQMR